MRIVTRYTVRLLGLLAVAWITNFDISVAAATPEPTLRFEQVVTYKSGEPIALDARVGTVRISSITFKPGTPLRAVFAGENVGPDDWIVRFTVDLIDEAGKTIQSRAKTWEYNVKADDVPILFSFIRKDVLPQIKQARIRILAELDE